MANSNLKYLIAGTGGVGGSIAAFLSLSGKDVTCIARGEHLAAIRGNGLQLHSDLKGEHCLKVAAFTAEEFQGKADVIFVCVKGYSVDSITELIKRASHERTVVIPILNVYGTGPRIQRLVPGVTVLDGCIYIVGFVSGRGEITQMGKIFRLVYGAHRSTIVSRETLEAVQRDLQESGIKADIVTVAKGIGNGFPMAGVLISPMFTPVYGQLGTTFGGNHLACSAALAVLDVIEQENLIENAAQVGNFLITELKKFPQIKDVRGRGLMIGLEFEEPIKELRLRLLKEQHVFTGVSGTNVLRLLPPLCLGMDEAKEFLERFKKVL